MNDTKVAALFKPSTMTMHKEVQQAVLDVFNSHPHTNFTRQELAVIVRKPINCITAPVKGMLDAGILVEHERVRAIDTNCLRWALKLKKEIE